MQTVLPAWLSTAQKGSLDIVLLNADKDSDRVKHYISKNDIKLVNYMDTKKNLLNQIKAISVPSWAVYEVKGRGDYLLVDTAGGFDEARVKKALNMKI